MPSSPMPARNKSRQVQCSPPQSHASSTSRTNPAGAGSNRHRGAVPRPGVAGEPQRDAVLHTGGLQPPGRQGQVTEHAGREQAVRHLTGPEELDQLLGERVGAGLVLRGGHGGQADAPAAAARLAPTTVMVALSASVGLNSTTSVPAVMTGVCPAGA